MRILHVYAGPFPSHQGTQVYLRGLLGAQVARGHRVALRCWAGGVGAGPAGIEIRRLLPLPGSFDLRSGPSVGRAPLALALAAALRRDLAEPWDAVHLHHVEAPLLAPHGPFLRVHHLHTELRAELPTYAVSGVAIGGVRACLRTFGGWLDQRCARGADLVVALSPQGAEVARAAGAARVAWVPPGVEPMERAPPPPQEGPRWVLYTGNLDGYQDLDLLLRQVVRHRLHLRVVTAAAPHRLHAAAARAGLLPDRLRLTRATSLTVLRQAIAESVVGVVPRRCCAGFPMKVLPSLAMGRPVVGWRNAIPDLPGLDLVSGDEGALGDHLAALVNDAARVERLGGQGRDYARQALSWGAVAAKIESLVRSGR